MMGDFENALQSNDKGDIIRSVNAFSICKGDILYEKLFSVRYRWKFY